MILERNFVLQAMRTNSNLTGTFKLDPEVIHAMLGVSSEVFEFLFAKDANNAFEEFGDMFWFAALFQHATGISISLELKPDDASLDIVEEATKLIDYLKAMYAYGGKKGQKIEDLLYVTAEHISRALRSAACHMSNAFPERSYEKLIQSAQETVINKLKARYPEKFTAEHAQNRDLGYETEVIAKSINA
jgi:hypothetical protein